MKKHAPAWATAVALVFLAVTFLFYESQGATRSIEELAAQEVKLVAGKCTKAELVDRWLLQQSWFHDPGFTELAGAFGQSSFTLYKKQTTTKRERFASAGMT